MKTVLIFVFNFFPWVIGIIDIIWWFFTNHSSGIVPWEPVRIWMAFVWPMVIGLIILKIHEVCE